MMKHQKYLSTPFVLLMILALLCSCGKSAVPAGSAKNTAGENQSDSQAASSLPSTPAPTPTATPMPPQNVFIDGAKELLSTDVVSLLTEKEDDATLFGMPSSFLYDLNNSTNETAFSAAFNNVVEDGKKKDQGGTFSLNCAHDASSGDSSIVMSLGLGTDTNSNAGIYITGGTALLKSASASHKIILYKMGGIEGNTFLDKASGLLSGLLSDDGKASTFSGNLKDRKELAARYLDPWTNDTKPEEYADAEQTRSLLGADVPCRVITLSMAGERAYSFVLEKMKALGADAQFKDMNGSLGDLMYLLSTDIKDQSSDANSKSGAAVNPATKQLIDELNGLTGKEIAAAKFVVSVIFNGEKAIGIEIEASTTGKAFKLNLLLYRKGPEHQISLFYQSVNGATASVELTKSGTGGNGYNVTGQVKITNANGVETTGGKYGGTVTETDSQYNMKGTFSLNLEAYDTNGKKQKLTFGGDIAFGQTYQKDAGYTGSGSGSLSIVVPSHKLQMKMLLSLNSKLKDSVAIKPPIYIKSKAVTVTTEQQLFTALGQKWKDISKNSKPIQALSFIVSMLVS